MAREKGKAYGFSFPDDSLLQGVSGPNDGFLLNTLITNFRLSRVFLDVWLCILSKAIEFVSIWSSRGT